MVTTHSKKPAKGGSARGPAQRASQPTTTAPAATREQAQRLSGAYNMGPAVAMRAPVQAKLTVGRAGDSYEREADRVAERVAIGQPAGDVSRIPPGGLAAQRQTEDTSEGSEETAQERAVQREADEDTEDAQAQTEEGGEETEAQMKCAACKEGEEKKAQRKEEETPPEAAQAKSESDSGEKVQSQESEDSGEMETQTKDDDKGSGDTEAQTKGDENTPEESAQMKCAACEAERTADSGGGGGTVQRQAEPAEAAAPSEETNEGEVQKQTEAGAEGDGAESSEGADAESRMPECGPGEGGPAAEAEGGAGAEAEGEEAAGEESGETEEAGEEGAGGGEDLGCGEETGESEEEAAEGGASCGGGAEAGAESEGAAEGEGPAAEAGAAPRSEERPAAAAGAVPACGEPVEAAEETEGEEESESAQGGGAEGGGECSTAQRKEKDDRNRLDTAAASRLMHARGAGEPLAPTVRQRMEGSLGVDLGGVRVHADSGAHTAARALRAKAFTSGNNIYLAVGQSPHDVSLMAHEGTHVLQQEGIARRKPAEGAEGAAPAPSQATVASPASPVPASGRPAKVAAPAGAAQVAPSPEPTPGAAAPPSGGAQPPAPPVAPPGAAAPPLPARAARGTTAPSPAAAAAKGTAPAAAAMPARPPAAAASATSAVSAPDVAPARAPVVSRSIAPPDPSAFTGEPSDSLSALAALSPVRAPFAFRMFRDGVDGSLTRRRASEHRDAPHGRYQARSPNLPDGRPTQPPVAAGPAPTTGGFASAASASPGKVTVASEDAGPAPAVDTTSREREVEAIDEKKPGAIELVREWLRRFFASVPTSDNNVNTDPGPVPTITYTKDSDPAEVQTIEDENRAKVTHGLEEADEERDDDFGEHEIEPELEDGEEEIPVPAHVHEMGTGCDPEAEAEPLAFDAPHEAELAERVHAETGSRWAAETHRLDASEEERDRKISDERAALPGRIAAAHTNAYREEDEAAGAARAEVDRLRESWGDENRGVQTRFEEQSTCEAGCARGAITDHVGKEEGLIAERHQTDKTAAENEKKRVEEQARKEKEEAERKAKSESSGGLLSRGVNWLKNKAKSALAWVARKVKGWFDDLRAWVRKKFDEFKQWVNEKIEAARRWINEKLEGLRRRFHALVDKYLGEYPEIAARFHNAIDKTIDAAQAAVNRAADRLKRAVNKLIDGLAKAVDVALAVVEKVVVGIFTVACDIVVIGSNLVVAFVEGDLEAMITLVRELPDWPPLFGGLMSVVRAGFLGFLERMHAKPADVKKRFVEKLRGLLTSGKYYGGVFLGILHGLVVEGLWGTITMIYDIIKSIPEIITNIYNAIKDLASDVEAIAAIADRFRATEAEIKAFLDRPESAQEMIAMLKRSPQILVAMIDKALHEGREWSYRAGAKAADALFNWILTASNYDIGLAVGSFIGQVVFEVLLLVFTAGAGTAVKWGGKALQWLMKGLRMVTARMHGAGSWVMKGITLLREVVVAGLTAARRLGGTIKKVLAKLGELVDKVFDWFRRAFGKVGRKLARKVSPEDRARWIRFKLEVKQALAGHPDGMTKGAVQGKFRGILTRYRDVVGWPTVITKKGAYFRLWARPKKGLRPRPVGRVLQDRDTRWKEGKDAVEDAIRGLKRRVDNIDASRIDAALAPVKREFRYTLLQSRFDEAKNEFVVEGSMSAKRKVVKVAPKRPTANKVTIQDDSKHVRVNPLVRKTPVRSEPSGDPPHWAEVQPIKTVSGRTSLYRQGHLVSGYFLGGDAWNLTPITFSANSLMAARAETPVRKKLPRRATESSSAPIFNYDVKGEGKAGSGGLLKRTFMKDGKPVCETVPAEAKLFKTITISISAFGYNDKSHQWDRSVPLPKGAQPGPVHNLPPFPAGQPCPKPKKKGGKRT